MIARRTGKSIGERLENRILLAADLHVLTEQPDGPFVAGAEVSYSFTVTNRGDDLEQVRIVDLPTESLDDVSWQRSELTFPTNSEDLAFETNGLIYEDQNSDETNTAAYPPSAGGGDFNGDGLGDAVIATSRKIHLMLGRRGRAPHRVALVPSGPQFGIPFVAGVGDVDHDGFDDFAVAWQNSYTDREVFIVHGNPDLLEVSGRELQLPGAELRTTQIVGLPPHLSDEGFLNEYWIAISNAGDLNGDAREDISLSIVSISQSLSVPTQAYVLFGGSIAPGEVGASIDLQALDGSDGFSIDWGEEPPSDLAVAGGGDLNGDGLEDLAMATPERLHIVYGRPDIGSEGTIDPATLEDESGFSINGIDVIRSDAIRIYPEGQTLDISPDFNGDGIGDLLTGKAVLFGGSDWMGSDSFDAESLDGRNGFRISAQGDAIYFRGIGDVGDVNGDGIADLGIGVNRPPEYRDRFYTNRSDAYVVFGSEDIGRSGEVALHELTGDRGFRYREVNGIGNYAFTGIGDANGDSVDDLAISTTNQRFGPFISTGWGDGPNFVIFGQAPVVAEGTGDIDAITNIPAGGAVTITVSGSIRSATDNLVVAATALPAIDLTLSLTSELPESLEPGQEVAYSFEVANESDDAVDAALISDLLSTRLGNVTWTQETGNEPRRVLYDLAPHDAVTVDTATADALYAEERSIDFDGDGVDDDLDLLLQEIVIPDGLVPADWGQLDRASSLGDINADGYGDIWLAFQNSGETTGFVVFGSNEFGDGPPRVFADGSNVLRTEGFLWNPTAAGIGDINADGVDDFMIGSSRIMLEGRGAAFVIFGSPDLTARKTLQLESLDGLDGFALTGARRYLYLHVTDFDAGDDVGERVGAAGDFNGDGIDDFLVGSSPCDPTATFCLPDTALRLDHVVFGRSPLTNGTGPIEATVSIPPGAVARYTVTGIVPDDFTGTLAANIMASLENRQVDPDPENNSASIAVQIVQDEVPFPGDLNGDGAVGVRDFLILSRNFGRTDATRDDGDLDGDGEVSVTDFLVLSRNFGTRVPTP